MLVDDFDGPELDRSVWLPHYLPAWSSLAATAATYDVAGSCLRLWIPPSQGLWMAGEQHPPLRVSGVQTGNFSGPAGSTAGQQPLPGGFVVREAQTRFEVFGDALEPGRSAAAGMGLHPFRDPAVTEDFAAPRLPVDVAAFHDYAVRWTPEEVVFLVDGEAVRRCPRPPDYPMQSMVAVFDFPDRSAGDDADLVPELVVDHLGWTPLA